MGQPRPCRRIAGGWLHGEEVALAPALKFPQAFEVA